MVWDVDREIVGIGIFALRWYSLLFALGIVVGYFIMKRMFEAEGKRLELLDSLLFHTVIGTVVGARLGHCLLYEPETYLRDPIRILQIWEGGLASHGGYFGVMIALMLYCRRYREISWFWVADRMTVLGMVTGGLIRIGNFFNSEIIGRQTDVPWAVIFKKVDMVPRHPTQLYEAAGYLTIAAIEYGVYRAANRKPQDGRMFGLVLILGYGFRLFIEIFKENQVDFENTMVLNMGQLLSIPFILIGLFFFFGFHLKMPFFKPALTSTADAFAAGHVPAEAQPAEAAVSRRGQLRKQQKKANK
jgi:phosphatidylglycerol:prolipoprotein diacylglycerol transferase